MFFAPDGQRASSQTRGAPNLPIVSVRVDGAGQEGACQLHHMRLGLGSGRKHHDKGFGGGVLVLPASSLGAG